MRNGIFRTACFTLSVLAVASQSWADGHSEGLSLGQSNLNKLSSNVSSSNAKSMPFYTDTPAQASQFGSSSLFNVGTGRINSCKTAVHGPDQVANQECDAVNFLAKNPYERITVGVDPHDPIIGGIGDVINGATGGSVDASCGTKTTTTPDKYKTEVCNIYNVSDPKSCSMGQIVDVDAKANFQCNVTHNAVETQSCDKVLNVQCSTPVAGCDNGGIVPGSVAGDMATTWGPDGKGNYVLQFGLGYGYQFHDGSYDRDMTLNIANLDLIQQFSLSDILFDDFLLVSVNGVVVYNGPYGGNKLELVNGRVDIGDGVLRNPDGGRPWQVYPGTDLRPFLHNGANTIHTRTVVGGDGGLYVKFATTMLCPGACTYSWDDQCTQLDARTR